MDIQGQATTITLEPFIPITTDTIGEFAACTNPVSVTAGSLVNFEFGTGCVPDIRIDSEFPTQIGSATS